MRLVCIVFLFLSFSDAAFAQECEQGDHHVYVSYIAELQAGSETIHRFNLPFLANELKANNLNEGELSKRLSRYTFALDRLNSNVLIDGFYIPKNSDCNFFVYKVSDPELGYGNYVFVRLVAHKIVNISFEEGHTEVDGKALSQLLYTKIK